MPDDRPVRIWKAAVSLRGVQLILLVLATTVLLFLTLGVAGLAAQPSLVVPTTSPVVTTDPLVVTTSVVSPRRQPLKRLLQTTGPLVANSVRLTVSTATQTVDLAVGLRAEVLDGDGQPGGAGIPVSFTTTLGNVQPPGGDTDAAGVVTATLTSTRTGTAIVTAHADDTQGAATVVFTPGPPEAIDVVANPPAIPVDGAQSQIRATLADRFGNRVGDGITVTFASSLGTVNPVTATTVAGRVTTILASGPVHGRSSVTVTVGVYTGATNVEFLPADLRILSVHSPTGDISPGTAMTYTISFENAGNTVARDVVITDTLPVGLIDTWYESSGATITTTQGTGYVWEVEDLSPGEGGTITLHGGFDRHRQWPISEFVANVARIGSATAEGNPVDNVTSAGNLIHTADVFVQMLVDSSGTDLQPGGKIKYQVFLGNYEAPAHGLTITSTLPTFTTLWRETSYEIPGLTHVTGDEAPVQTWRFDGTVDGPSFGNFVIWLNIDANAPGGAILRHRVEVSSDTTEGNYANNLQVIERRLPGVNLEVLLMGPATVIPARMITYTLRYTNTGTLPAAGVLLTDTLPPGVSVIDVSRPARIEPGRIEWDLGSVADGQWGQIDVVGRVGADVRAGQALHNAVDMTTTSAESFTGDNTSATDTWVVPDAPDSLTLGIEPTTIVVGAAVPLTVAVADQFANPITGLTVTLTTTVGSITPTVLTTVQGVGTATFMAPESPVEGDITAASGDLFDVAHVVIEPGPAWAVRLEATAYSLPADGHSTSVVRAFVTDRFGNPVQDGTPVIFDVDHGTLYNGQSRHEVGTFDGIASTILTTDRLSGRAVVIASADTASAEIIIEFVEVPWHKVYLPLVARSGE